MNKLASDKVGHPIYGPNGNEPGSYVRVDAVPSRVLAGTEIPEFTGWVIGEDEDERNGHFLLVMDMGGTKHPVLIENTTVIQSTCPDYAPGQTNEMRAHIRIERARAGVTGRRKL